MSRSLTVQEMVDAELQRDPSVSLTDLKWLAERVDPSLTELSDDEFGARYAAGAGQAGATETSRPAKKAGGVKKARSGAARRKSAAAAARKRPAAKAAPKAPAKAAKKAPAKSAKSAPAKAAKQTPAKAAKKTPAKTARQTPTKAARKTPSRAPKKAVANPATTAGGGLASARAALLDFARDLTAAESRGELVKVLADVDRYARRVLDARG